MTVDAGDEITYALTSLDQHIQLGWDYVPSRPLAPPTPAGSAGTRAAPTSAPSRSAFSAVSDPARQPPDDAYMLATGLGGDVLMGVPLDGTIWISYEPLGDPAKHVFISHEGQGTRTPIAVGEQLIAVQTGDLLVYALTSLSQSIQLAWVYQS
jgi:hypothetical protein